MIIQGDSIRLRQASDRDVDAIYNWENDVEHWFVSDTVAPYSREEILQFVQSANDIFLDGQMRLIIENLEGELVGCIDFFAFDLKNKRVGLGILIDAAYRGHGFGKEAVKLAYTYAFESLEVHSVFAEVAETNIGSQKIFIASGFAHTATKLDWLWDGQEFQNQLVFQKINS